MWIFIVIVLIVIILVAVVKNDNKQIQIDHLQNGGFRKSYPLVTKCLEEEFEMGFFEDLGNLFSYSKTVADSNNKIGTLFVGLKLNSGRETIIFSTYLSSDGVKHEGMDVSTLLINKKLIIEGINISIKKLVNEGILPVLIFKKLSNYEEKFIVSDIKEECYLIKSGALDKDVLDKNNKLELYNDLLKDANTPDNMKTVINQFLIPYKISFIKFGLNTEFFDSNLPFSSLYEAEYEHISPSLRKIQENRIYIPRIYPKWVFAAFPDVILWLMKGNGRNVLKDKFNKLTESELTDDGYIKLNILKEIITKYQIDTNKSLECKIY